MASLPADSALVVVSCSTTGRSSARSDVPFLARCPRISRSCCGQASRRPSCHSVRCGASTHWCRDGGRTSPPRRRRPAPAAPDGPVHSSRESGATLRRLVWDPLAPHLGNASRVFIVTDGLLNIVAFAALPVGQRSYLLENRLVIHYLSAERDIVLSSQTPTPERGLLAIGGPSFDDASLFRARQRRSRSAALKAARPARRCAPRRRPGLRRLSDRDVPPAHRHPAGSQRTVRPLGDRREIRRPGSETRAF